MTGRQFPRRGGTLWPILAFLAALLLYVRTLVPGVFVSDFAEFQYLPARLGLAHPNGFPLYMLLGKAWSTLPVGNLAWRMNLLSAVAGAAAVGLTVGFVRRLSGHSLAGLLAGGLLGLSPTFWLYSLAAERYTLNLALLVGAVWCMWEAVQRRAPKWAQASSLLLALGLATHPSDALLLPFWLLALGIGLPAQRWSIRFWLGLAGIGAAVQLLYLYAPWRWLAFSGWPPLPGVGRSSAVYAGLVHVWYEPGPRWDLMLRYVLGLGDYATGLVRGGWSVALARAGNLFPFWLKDVPWPATLLGLAGLATFPLRRSKASGFGSRWTLSLTLGGFAALLFLMVAYIQQGKNDAYLVPSFWVAFVGAGLLAGRLLDVGRRLGPWPQRGVEGVLALGIAGLLAASLIQRYPGLDHSRWTESRTWWEDALQLPVEEGAGLLSHWSDLTPLWYIQQSEGRRTDLVGLFPPDTEKIVRPWLTTGRPLYLAAPLHGWAPELAEQFQLTPWGRLLRIAPLDATPPPCPVDGPPLETPDPWPIDITAWRLEPDDAAGAGPRLWLCWRARTELPRRTFLALHLQAADGPALALDDPLVPPWSPQTAFPAGATGFSLLRLDAPLGRAPGQYQVTIMPFSFRESDGQAVYWPGVEPIRLDTVHLTAQTGFRRRLLGEETAPIIPPSAGPLRLRAFRVSREAVRPGDPLQVEMLWEIVRPVEHPVALSLRLRSFWGKLVSQERWTLAVSRPDLPEGSLLRTTHILNAPRGRGNHTYWVEPRLFVDGEPVAWQGSGRLLIGRVHVLDREHLTEPPPGITPAPARFGDVAELLGYNLTATTVHPGEEAVLTLHWRALSEPERSDKVFVHLVDGQGNLVAQHDSMPAEGVLPTSLWVQGEVISDRHPIQIPETLPPGVYALRVGFYDPETGARLPITLLPGGPQKEWDGALEVGRLVVE